MSDSVRLAPDVGEKEDVALMSGWTHEESVESELNVVRNEVHDEVMLEGMRVEFWYVSATSCSHSVRCDGKRASTPSHCVLLRLDRPRLRSRNPHARLTSTTRCFEALIPPAHLHVYLAAAHALVPRRYLGRHSHLAPRTPHLAPRFTPLPRRRDQNTNPPGH